MEYGTTFDVGTPQPNDIGRVSLIRLPSVTHSFDQNQHINFLQFQAGAAKLTITAPSSANKCPPGHYMLFILSKAGVPSIAKIIQIQVAVVLNQLMEAAVTRAPHPSVLSLEPVVSKPENRLQLFERHDAMIQAAKGTAVVVGITGTCPYGISACWGGAYEALSRLEAVKIVGPIPNAGDSTATVYLEDERLPALAHWHAQFRSIVNGTYALRGVEVTLRGSVSERDGKIYLTGNAQRPAVRLLPLAGPDRIQWSHANRALKPLDPGEDNAYQQLAATTSDRADRESVTITGPLQQTSEDTSCTYAGLLTLLRACLNRRVKGANAALEILVGCYV